MDANPKFLLIRRDNIGDLVCITPLFRALRERFPSARICALVNSYNRPVLENNPDIDEIFSYTKAKHRAAGQSLVGVYFDRIRLILKLRRERFDYAILAAPGYQERSLRLARLIRPKRILGFIETEHQGGVIELPVRHFPVSALHEVEDVFRLAGAIGITGTPPAATVYPAAQEVRRARGRMAQADECPRLTIGIHISARKLSQRWPVKCFTDLVDRLNQQFEARFLLFWSPGDGLNPLHPGDDAKAREIMQALPEIPILAYPTHQLGELIAGLSLCDVVICSDGGAMHLAAGLGKPILCFFGQSDASHWYPWGVPYVLLQPESRDVRDIGVTEALQGFGALVAKANLPAVFRK